jgi:hypothetical protein
MIKSYDMTISSGMHLTKGEAGRRIDKMGRASGANAKSYGVSLLRDNTHNPAVT